MRKKELWVSMVAMSCLFVFSLASVPGATAGEYPDKTIEFVIHSSPGSGADLWFRTVALMLNNEGIVKPKIQVSNKQGGSATVAINYLATKKGDPYVVQTWTTAPIVTVLRGTTTVKDPLDLTILCSLSEDPNLLVVRADSKYKNLNDMVEDARKNPDQVKLGINTVGGSEHIVANRLEKAAKVTFNKTAFSQSPVALLGGHIEAAVGNLVETGEHLKAKKFRAVASVGEKRTQFLPDVPTMKEQGINASFTQVRGFWGPPEMPKYAVEFWEKAFAKLLETKAFRDYMKSVEMEPAYMGAEESRKFLVQYNRELLADVKDLEVYGGKK